MKILNFAKSLPLWLQLSAGVTIAGLSILIIAGSYIQDTPPVQIYSISLLIFILFSVAIVQFLFIRPLRDVQKRIHEHVTGIETTTGTRLETSAEFKALYQELDNLALHTTSKSKLEEEIRQRKQVEEDLALARDEAIAASSAKGAFLANMSHEIRTPLTAIIGFSESLMDSNQSMSDRFESIQTVIKSGKHLQSLLNDILDLSKIEAGKLEINSTETKLFDIVKETHALAKLQAEEKGLYCELDYHFPLPETITTDPLRIKQILINLCGNAVKFTQNGGVTVSVKYREDKNEIHFDVKDTGIGISPEQFKNIFIAFEQADTTTTRKFGGTGLGLFLSQSLAEMLGGTIRVESFPNQGSTFSLIIKASENSKPILISEVPKAEKPVKNSVIQKLSGHVLLTEDNVDNQQLISFLLRRLGLEVTLAQNGQESVDILETHDFDLVLMDMQMPVMDGLTATRILRERGYNKPIIALTANAMLKDKQDCFEAGCTNFLTKPIDRELFYTVITNYITPEPKGVEEKMSHAPILKSTLLDEDPEMAELVDIYIEKLPEIIDEIHTAYKDKDWELLRRLVHNLKSTGGNYGFMPLSDLASQLEFQVIKQDETSVQQHMSQMDELKIQICG